MDFDFDPTNIYKDIFDRLSKEKIFSFDESLCKTQTDYWPEKYKYTDPLHDLFADVQKIMSNNITGLTRFLDEDKREGLKLIFPPCTQVVNGKNNKHGTYQIVDSVIDSIIPASLVCSNRAVFLTRAWCHHSDNDEDDRWIPPDFWYQLFKLKHLLLSGDAILVPVILDVNSWWEETVMPFEYHSTDQRNKYVISHGQPSSYYFSDSIAGPKDPLLDLNRINEATCLDKSLLGSIVPWISSPDIRYVLDFKEKHLDSFTQFQMALSEMIECNKDSEDKIARKVTHAFTELDTRLGVLESSLKFKSISVAVGVICALGIALTPETINTIISQVIGTKTLWDAVQLVGDTRNLKSSLKGHDFWFPWHCNKTLFKQPNNIIHTDPKRLF